MPSLRSLRRVTASILLAALTAAPAAPAPTAAAQGIAPPPGATRYTALAPQRLAETLASDGAFGLTRPAPNTIRIQVAGRTAVPANATAAVLNITSVNGAAPGFVTVHPTQTPRPTASNLNTTAGAVIANMATVKLGVDGSVDIYSNVAMDFVVDISGIYQPTNTTVTDGRLETRPAGPHRVIDTRDRGYPMSPGSIQPVDVTAAGVPTGASAVVVNITAINGNVGFWVAYPAGQQRPATSTVNLDRNGQIRAGQAIVQLPGGVRTFNVYSQSGGHLAVDVAGWFTGTAATSSIDGLLTPSTPQRAPDTRTSCAMAPWNGSVFEVNTLNPVANVAAVAMNLTGTEPWAEGFVTGYPAGVARPVAS